ncbi:MAG TPA: sugar transferase [Acetobacteraceae bacterium]|nr:sugar transferase [Acetobacteraceae bacterium]
MNGRPVIPDEIASIAHVVTDCGQVASSSKRMDLPPLRPAQGAAICRCTMPDEVWHINMARRARDIAGALLLLTLTFPLLLLTALVIKFGSPGPLLYRQVRVGRNGRLFTMLKLRSMRVDAEASGPCWAAVSDPRVTRVGAFIRAYRIDELPQLINVLRGEISLVGPRPERPHFAAELGKVLVRYAERTCVLPGITGWAQVKYRYGASVEDARVKLDYDLDYIARRSLLLDLRILAATITVVLFRIGAR